MALIDDPGAWILKMFRMEERERGGEHLLRFDQGTRQPWSQQKGSFFGRLFGGAAPPELHELPLEPGELVRGVYKEKYVFTEQAFIVRGPDTTVRLPWVRIVSAGAERGKKGFILRAHDGASVSLDESEFRTGSAGRIWQLIEQLVERHGALGVPAGRYCTLEEFIALRPGPEAILPNMEPRPDVQVVIHEATELQSAEGVRTVRLELAADEPEPTVIAVLVCAMEEALPHLERFAEQHGADGVLPCATSTGIKHGEPYWRIVWD